MLIYGAKKIGKTSMMRYFRKPFYFMFEPGGSALRIYQKPMPDWRTFTRHVPPFLKQKVFNIAIIDTIDLAYKACFDGTCKKMGIEHPSDESYGKGWEAVKNEFTKWIMMRMMAAKGKGLVMLSHEHIVGIKSRSGMEVTRIEPSMPKQAKEIVDAAVDIWGYYTYDGVKRVLQIQGDDVISAGHRCEGRFLWPDGEPIRYIPMGNSPEQSFKNFEAAFYNKLPREKGGAKKVSVPGSKPTKLKVRK